MLDYLSGICAKFSSFGGPNDQTMFLCHIYDKGRHSRNVGEYFFDCMKRLDFFCNSPSIFAYQAISSGTTNKDPQDIKVESANLLPCPFKKVVVSAAATSC